VSAENQNNNNTSASSSAASERPAFGGGRPGGGEGRPGGGRGGRPGGGRGGKRYFFRRRKVCKPCADKIDHIDYKDIKLLSQFVPERGKLLPRRMFGTCAEHQRKLTLAIKRARHIALLPFQGD
jgi:small subunit ribosomal protein S18